MPSDTQAPLDRTENCPQKTRYAEKIRVAHRASFRAWGDIFNRVRAILFELFSLLTILLLLQLLRAILDYQH